MKRDDLLKIISENTKDIFKFRRIRDAVDAYSSADNGAKPIVSGSLPLDKSHICFDKGHNMFLVTEIDNGRSKYGYHKCSRCGWVDSFQYDYGSW